MDDTTHTVLHRAAGIVSVLGLHTGEQFAAADSDAVDVCGAIYLAAEGTFPAEFSTDEVASIRLIECSARAMQAIRALSEVLDTQPPTTQVTDDHAVPDYIEHVCHWASTTPVFGTRPPTTSEVIGRILRAHDALEPPAARTSRRPTRLLNKRGLNDGPHFAA